uniref:Secreted protein n=1 Tax=Micrurus lemniscatus lemniscatus TaxID=129467 RepID=A0A2D4H6X7_MICLE
MAAWYKFSSFLALQTWLLWWSVWSKLQLKGGHSNLSTFVTSSQLQKNQFNTSPVCVVFSPEKIGDAIIILSFFKGPKVQTFVNQICLQGNGRLDRLLHN